MSLSHNISKNQSLYPHQGERIYFIHFAMRYPVVKSENYFIQCIKKISEIRAVCLLDKSRIETVDGKKNDFLTSITI
jgi:hypothetical protein